MTLPPPPPRPPQPRPPSYQAHQRAPRRPVHRGIWVGAAMLVCALMAAGAWLFSELPNVSDEIDRFHRASPQFPVEFTVEEAVDWDVFIEPSSASRSGLRFEIVDAEGEPVRLGSDHGFTYNWFSRSGRSIASAALDPGTYRMTVTEGTASVAIGDSPGAEIFRAVGGGVLIGGVLGLSGIVVMIMSAVRDTRRRNQNNEPPPPSPWSSGEWSSGEWPEEPGR